LRSYYRSSDFRDLKASTQSVRRNIIERFRNGHGNKPVARLERRHIKDIIGTKAETPEAANNLLSHQSRCDRTRQQTRKDGVGNDGQG
jgi:hypothetical protein